MSGIKLRQLKANDQDLAQIADQLNLPTWEDFDNKFSAASLKAFLEDKNRVYLVAYVGDNLAGAAHGYLMQHPAGPKYFYVDEVDTQRPYRRQGVATAMMNELFKIAKELGSSEVWLGADKDNEAAHALYVKLNPSEVEPGTIYTYKVNNG